MSIFYELFSKNSFWYSIIVIIVAILIWIVINKSISRYIKKNDITGRLSINIHFFATLIKYIIFILLVISILKINGVNVTSLVAGLGIIGIIVGFALQDILKDLIMGVSLVFDHFFVVGDVVKYNNMYGTIDYFNIKVTKIKDIETGDKITVCNRNITEIEKLSGKLLIEIPVPKSTPYNVIKEAFNTACDNAVKNKYVDDCKFLGVSGYNDISTIYMILADGNPKNRSEINIYVLSCVQQAMDEKRELIPNITYTIKTIK